MTNRPTIIWFRLDLRLADHQGLSAAIQRGAPVVPVFIWSPEEEGGWPPGAASRWWLHHSLKALAAELEAAGSRLLLRHGPALETLRSLAREVRASTLTWSERYEPAIRARDARVEAALAADGVTVIRHHAGLLHAPETVRNASRRPFQVFTPFWRQCLTQSDPEAPLPTPRRVPAPARWPASLSIGQLDLEPRPDWAGGLRSAWRPGTAGAVEALALFLDGAFAAYDTGRDRPDLAGTSRLSPHLHFGEISPREVWQAVRRRAELRGWPRERWRGSRFLTELGWREFAHHLLVHFPLTPDSPLRPEFEAFRWRVEPGWLEAWHKGLTGYPFVDAGMRELWSTGWMHNRVRMVAGSFLVKDLLISWVDGARWFWDTLVDADLAQNTLGWQWTAGCGADAAPYFRVFNPTSQGEKFDPQGDYVRRWVPELARLPNAWIHRPSDAPADVLARAGVTLGKDYPEPLVRHAIAREVALEAFQRLKNRRPAGGCSTPPKPGRAVTAERAPNPDLVHRPGGRAGVTTR